MNLTLFLTNFFSAFGLYRPQDSQTLIPPIPEISTVQLPNAQLLNPTHSSRNVENLVSQSLLTCGLCNNSSKSISTRIIGGKDVSIDLFPWQVSIQKMGTFGLAHFCGGALIHPNWIVTAAHCMEWTMSGRSVRTDAQKSIRIVVGSQTVRVSSRSSMFRVNKIISHPNYNRNTAANDIALLSLETPIDFNKARSKSINSICLPTKGQEFSGIVTTSGWGTTKENGESSYTLRAVDLPMVSSTQCKRVYRRQFITELMVCAGEEGKDSCQGDSGGALIHRDASGRATLVGIVSVGNGCGRRGYPGIYTKASFYIDWIQKTIST